MAGPKARATLSGTVTGVRMATKAYEPSLMPRSAIDQGLIVGGSFLSGFIAGAAASLTFEVLPRRATTPLLRIAGVVATGSHTARSLSVGGDTAEAMDPAGAGWLDFGSEVLSAVALSRLILETNSALARTGALATVGLTTAADTGTAIAARTDEPDAKYIALSAGVGLVANAAVAALATGIRVGGWLPARALPPRTIARAGVSILGSLATGAAIVYGAKVGIRRVTNKIAEGNRATEIAFAAVPVSPSVSGSAASTIPYRSLGVQGRRLVSDVTSGADIAEIMAEPPISDPVRVYVGVDSAVSDESLIDAAMAELHRTGAFDRSIIIAASPAGTGYVNYIAIEAAELMSRGDCATVAVQYGSLPSMLSMNKIQKASRLYAMLLTRIRKSIAESGSSAELVAYGESLGALAGQAGVEAASRGGALIVDRALWVGTPQGSPLFEKLTSAGAPVFDHPNDLASYLADRDAPPYVFLNHHNDPVTKFAPADLYRIPDWLTVPDRGRGTNPNQRWVPGVTFFQGLIDTKNAATVIPGQFFSTGHDYRADLASFVAAAYGFSVTDDQMARIEERLRESEIRRSDAIALGKIHSA
ncbi:MAG: alpha/beta hydrolase [Acidimicrobiia bacterium]|nr:alpha/beta hydrolase [Acidimicrobiia bacterium]